MSRHYTAVDHLLINADIALRTLIGRPQGTERANPADQQLETELEPEQRQLSARLMRINHTGEVCAQGLYQGQALTAQLGEVRARMERAAEEENDHLLWCEQRVKELDSHTSVLNPLFYLGSLSLGALAGAIGDRWSLGFVVETEKQVMRHLDEHLEQLPASDQKSRAILQQMHTDEGQHAQHALDAGGAPFPAPVKLAMKLMSKVMTGTTYWV